MQVVLNGYREREAVLSGGYSCKATAVREVAGMSVTASSRIPSRSGSSIHQSCLLPISYGRALPRAFDHDPVAIAAAEIHSGGPGSIVTPLVDAVDAATREAIANLHAMKRMGLPEEVASLICVLVSDAASYIRGSYHLVDGGCTAQVASLPVRREIQRYMETRCP